MTGAPASIGPTASRTWSTSTTPTPCGSCWCKTTPSTHTPASLYEAFAPAEAKRLADKLELHYTPKHGSWLNMAEIELAMLAGQCLDRRLADRATLEREVHVNLERRRRPGSGPGAGRGPGSRRPAAAWPGPARPAAAASGRPPGRRRRCPARPPPSRSTRGSPGPGRRRGGGAIGSSGPASGRRPAGRGWRPGPAGDPSPFPPPAMLGHPSTPHRAVCARPTGPAGRWQRLTADQTAHAFQCDRIAACECVSNVRR